MCWMEHRFRDDIQTKLAAFERTVHDYENQSTKTVDDIKMGVTMLGMEDMRVKKPHPEQRQDHRLDTDTRRDSRDHANTAVHRQSTNANEAWSESEEQGQGQRQGRQGQRQGCKERIVQESKKKDDQRKCFYCNKSGHVKAECRKRLKDLAEAEGKPVAATPHPSDTATVVPLQCLTARRERHVNVRPGRALGEQRNDMRVFL